MRFRELLEYKRNTTIEKLGVQFLQGYLLSEVDEVNYNNYRGFLKLYQTPKNQIDNLDQETKKLLDMRPLNGIKDHHKVWDELHKIVQNGIAQIEEADPSTNKQYVVWLIKTFIGEKVPQFEDLLSTVAESLAKFHQLKVRRRLPVELRDINRVTDILDWMEDIDEIWEESGIGVDKNNLKSQSKADVIMDNEEVRIIHPKNEQAACYYGQGTRWCTAATQATNYFDDYNIQGPLYIVIPKKAKYNGEKYQLHFETFNFMDERDKPESILNIMDRFESKEFKDWIKNIIGKTSEVGGNKLIYFMPEEVELDIHRAIYNAALEGIERYKNNRKDFITTDEGLEIMNEAITRNLSRVDPQITDFQEFLNEYISELGPDESAISVEDIPDIYYSVYYYFTHVPVNSLQYSYAEDRYIKEKDIDDRPSKWREDAEEVETYLAMEEVVDAIDDLTIKYKADGDYEPVSLKIIKSTRSPYRQGEEQTVTRTTILDKNYNEI